MIFINIWTRRDFYQKNRNAAGKIAEDTHDLLYIDRIILKEVKRRKKNLAAFDMIPHNWIMECLKIFELSKVVL